MNITDIRSNVEIVDGSIVTVEKEGVEILVHLDKGYLICLDEEELMQIQSVVRKYFGI